MGELATAADSIFDAQDACESALARAPASEMRAPSQAPTNGGALSLPESTGGVAGLAWDATRRHFLILDPTNGQVLSLDSAGRQTGRFGRLGEGPGEFDFRPLTRSFRNRLVAVDDRIVVADVGGVHEFDSSGRSRRMVRRYPTSLGGTYDLHVSTLDGEVIVGESGKGNIATSDSLVRSTLLLYPVPPHVDSLPRPILRFRNDYITMANPPAFPAQRPYLGLYRRTWDSNEEVLVAVSYRNYGVCFFGADSRLMSAHRVSLAPRPTDGPERERELRRVYSGPDAMLPVLGVSARQLYEPHWPPVAPLYHDVTLSEDSIAWVQRATPNGSVADIYHALTGYLTTVTLPQDRLPMLWIGAVGWYAAADDSGRLELLSWRPSAPAAR